MIRLVVLIVALVSSEITVFSALSQGATERTDNLEYTLIRTPEGQEIIQSGGGELFPVVTANMRGDVGGAKVQNNVAFFGGWAADIRNALFPEGILVFVNRHFFYSGQTGNPTRWLFEITGNPVFLESGFSFKFPLEEIENFENSEIRLFAFWKNSGAIELNYIEQMKPSQEQYKWKRKKNLQAYKPEEIKGELSPYLLISNTGISEVIRTKEEKFLPIKTGSMTARLSSSQIKRNAIEFWGWAADVESGESPKAILMFADEKLVCTGKTGLMTAWLLEKYESPSLAEAGFSFKFPLQEFKKMEGSQIRFFSLWNNGVVTEMDYHKDYQWSKKSNTFISLRKP